jgi:5-dehydro-2-deoxygluconokinase
MVFAFDHRNQFFELAQQTGADEARISQLKRLLVDAVAEVEQRNQLNGKIGLLLDDRYGQDALDAATGRGWWIGRPVELPGSSPLVFEHGRSVGSALIAWPHEHTVKCLVQYHPDDDIEIRLEQEAQVAALYQAVLVSGHELLLEVIPARHLPSAPDTVFRALKRFYNLGIYPDWWKLAPMSAAQWQSIDDLLAERDPACRGVVLLGLNASQDELAAGFGETRAARSCRGFMVGRTIFQEPSRRWLANEIGDTELTTQIRTNFESLIALWRNARGTMAQTNKTTTERAA